MPASVTAAEAPVTRRTNRRVDGRALCERLGVRLSYPTYREGIAQAIAALELE